MLAALLFVAVVSIILFASVFWIWMLIDCATKGPDHGAAKVVWILIILFTHTIGALLYFILRRPQRIPRTYVGRGAF